MQVVGSWGVSWGILASLLGTDPPVAKSVSIINVGTVVPLKVRQHTVDSFELKLNVINGKFYNISELHLESSTYKSHALFLAALLFASQNGLADSDGVPVEEVVGAGKDVVVVEPAFPAT